MGRSRRSSRKGSRRCSWHPLCFKMTTLVLPALGCWASPTGSPRTESRSVATRQAGSWRERTRSKQHIRRMEWRSGPRTTNWWRSCMPSQVGRCSGCRLNGTMPSVSRSNQWAWRWRCRRFRRRSWRDMCGCRRIISQGSAAWTWAVSMQSWSIWVASQSPWRTCTTSRWGVGRCWQQSTGQYRKHCSSGTDQVR